MITKRSIGKRGRWTTDAGQQTLDNDAKDGQRWKRRTTMEKTDNRWKGRTNDGKDGQTMEKMDKRWKRRTRFLIHLSSNFGWCHIYCKLI